MGWKNIKDHYRIDHHVQVTDEGICIGSGYIHDLILVSPGGRLVKTYDRTANEKIGRYQAEMQADPETLKRLATEADTFETFIRVYSYKDAEIIEDWCEETGWPNVTHTGRMMYDNTWSTDKARVVQWAKANAAAGIELLRSREAQRQADLAEIREHMATDIKTLATLERAYPSSPDANPALDEAREIVAEVLGKTTLEEPPETPLRDLGIDSIDIVAIELRLEEITGRETIDDHEVDADMTLAALATMIGEMRGHG